jgi:hypothetical protein
MTETIASIKPLLAVICPMIAAPCIFLSGKRPNIREGITILAAMIQFAVIISMAPVIMHGTVITFSIISIGAGIELGYRVDAFGLIFVDSGVAVFHRLHAIIGRTFPDPLLCYVRPGYFFCGQHCPISKSDYLLYFL